MIYIRGIDRQFSEEKKDYINMTAIVNNYINTNKEHRRYHPTEDMKNGNFNIEQQLSIH